jgi:hypothetical protein
MVQNGLLDSSQTADSLAHLNLGMTVSLEDRLGQIAEEMVGAIAVRHSGKFRRDPGHEGVLFVRDPEGHRLAQGVRPSLRLGDQPSDFVGRRGEQCLGEPDALPGQFADDVERLVPFLGLQAVDREDERVDPAIVLAEGFGVLLARGEHRLIAPDVIGDPRFGEVDGEGVEQFATDLRDGPVAGEAPMPDPTEDIPADAPTGQGDGRFDLGTLGLGVSWTAWVGTAIELADQMNGTVESEEVTMAMVADIHRVATMGAVTIDDVKLPESEVGLLRPDMGHGADLRVVRTPPVSILKLGKRIQEEPEGF